MANICSYAKSRQEGGSMTTATIHIPPEHLGAVRDSLRARRRELEADGSLSRGSDHLREIDAVIEQIDMEASGAPRPVTGPHTVLWNAAYDALCLGAERFAANCNELWRDSANTSGLRNELDELGARIDLLDGLGIPPDR
jgi:hypothetical protein